MMQLLSDFKEFATKGNITDMSVAFVMSAAFRKIVSSFVEDIIMPIIGAVIGGHNFKEYAYIIGESKILYGIFLQNIIDFLIIAFSMFMSLRGLSTVKKQL